MVGWLVQTSLCLFYNGRSTNGLNLASVIFERPLWFLCRPSSKKSSKECSWNEDHMGPNLAWDKCEPMIFDDYVELIVVFKVVYILIRIVYSWSTFSTWPIIGYTFQLVVSVFCKNMVVEAAAGGYSNASVNRFINNALRTELASTGPTKIFSWLHSLCKCWPCSAWIGRGISF